MTGNKYTNQDYLDFLSEKIDYGNGKPRPRARKIELWRKTLENIDNSSKINDYLDTPEKIWMWSDQHFGHNNIIRYSERPYDNTDEMTETLVKNYQECIKENDVCIWGGDIAFMSTNKANEILDQCPGYKILIIGNHDFERRKKCLKKYRVDEVHLVLNISYKELDLAFTHYPVKMNESMINVHGHIHNNTDGEFSDSLMNINISVEVLDYKPLNFTDLIELANRRKTSYEEH